jgi:hypothetical protein
VPPRIDDWAKIVGLTRTDERFAQFREDVTAALDACMRAHIGGKHRKRFSKVRKELMAFASAASRTARKLRPVQIHLVHLGLDEHQLEHFAQAARDLAEQWKRADLGPPSMLDFQVLAEGLIRAYRGATNQRGTGHGAREGRLLNLVKAVLPTALDLAERVTGEPLKIPSGKNLGDYVHDIARRPAGISVTKNLLG